MYLFSLQKITISFFYLLFFHVPLVVYVVYKKKLLLKKLCSSCKHVIQHLFKMQATMVIKSRRYGREL